MSTSYLTVQSGTGKILLKNDLDIVTGDVAETSFSAANNQSAAANVTGLLFSTGSVRGARIFLSVAITATSNLFEMFQIDIIQRDAGFDVIAYESIGDDSGLVFTVTTAGQIQYTSTDLGGFVSSAVRFRARVTPI